MTRGQFGADPRRTDERADAFAEQVGRALVRVANTTARELSETPGELDLVPVRAAWRRQVADVLLPAVEREWRRSADETWRAVADVLGEAADAPVVVAAVAGDQAAPQALVNAGTVSVPKVSILAARAYLETAENRLASVGDLLWAEMRAQLVEGLVAGEGSADVARRLRKTADLTTPRATVIARTEVIGATNRGAYAQMLATGLGGTKTWLATNDGRTRPSHAAADGATAEMAGTFTVGGHTMDGPHDPTAPPAETISCRCTLTYDVDVGSFEPSRVEAVEPGAVPTRARFSSFDDWNFGSYEAFDFAKPENAGLREMMARQGFTGLPLRMTREAVDRLGGTKIARGVTGGYDVDGVYRQAVDFRRQYERGEVFLGRGIYGNGSYFSEAVAEAEEYARGTGEVIYAVLHPDARVVDFDELKRMIFEDERVRQLLEANPGLNLDPSRLAVALGYDAIKKTVARYEILPGGTVEVLTPQYVVLNRTMTVIVDEA